MRCLAMFSKERIGRLLVVYLLFSLVAWMLLSDVGKNYDWTNSQQHYCLSFVQALVL